MTPIDTFLVVIFTAPVVGFLFGLGLFGAQKLLKVPCAAVHIRMVAEQQPEEEEQADDDDGPGLPPGLRGYYGHG